MSVQMRNRAKSSTALTGIVYTLVGGYQVLGSSYTKSPDSTMMDYWLKELRDDYTLPPSDLELDIIERAPPIMNRDTGTFRFAGYSVDDRLRTPGIDGTYKLRGTAERNAENNYYTQELLSRTNPFRHEYSVPISIKELVDVSLMFKLAAKTFASYVGGAYLNYKFGWVAFHNDIKVLAGITATIESRIKEFQSLNKHKGLRRKIRLDSKPSATTATDVTINSTYGTTVKCTNVSRRSMVVYGSVRWRAKDGFDAYIERLTAFNNAAKVVLDLEELDPVTAWGLIPFSWLVDYFVDISANLAAWDGMVEIEPYDICIMRHWRSTLKQTITSKPSNLTVTSGTYWREIKSRDVWTRGVYPVIRSGLLSSNQLLTLAALYARFRA